MRAPTADELLHVWEVGSESNAVQRALLLLAAVHPDTPPEELASLEIGQRDACLLLLRERLFGSRLNSIAACPQCGETLDLDFDVHDILMLPPPARPDAHSVQVEEWEVTFRLPNSLDLAAAGLCRTVDEAQAVLLARCVRSIVRGGEEHNVETLSPAAALAVAEAMAQADPGADIQVAVTCPSCVQGWTSSFDIVAYLWQEIQVWAQRTLRDVHVLASAYGWSEAEILALSPQRRRSYLDMVLQ